jgi:outer membrane murein-binding lipoprotein Lpp
MSSSSDAWLVDFAQARVNRIPDSIDGLAEQIKLTNNHVERLNREVGELRSEVGGLRLEMRAGFDRVDNELRDTRSEVILQANQIISAQQQATRAMLRLDDMEQRPDRPRRRGEREPTTRVYCGGVRVSRYSGNGPNTSAAVSAPVASGTSQPRSRHAPGLTWMMRLPSGVIETNSLAPSI